MGPLDTRNHYFEHQQKKRKIDPDTILFNQLEQEYQEAEKSDDIPKMLATLRKTVELIRKIVGKEELL